MAEILVTGFKYILCSAIPSSREFSVHGKKTLKINVTSPMPIIEIKYHAVPDVLLSGEIVRCVLEINNRGDKSLGKLGVKSSHASFARATKDGIPPTRTVGIRPVLPRWLHAVPLVRNCT